VMHDCSTNQMD